jgi:hypothetical protein
MKKSYNRTDTPFGLPKYSFTNLGKKVFFLGKWQWGFLLIGILLAFVSGLAPKENFNLDANGPYYIGYRVGLALVPPTVFYIVMVLYNILILLLSTIVTSLIKKDN